MRLQSALSMDQFAGLEEEEMGLFRSKEERRAKRKARRAKRKARRKKRRSERRQRKAARLRRRAGRLDSGGGRKRRRRGGGGGGGRGGSPGRIMRRGGMRRKQPGFQPTLQPAPQWPEAAEPQWPDEDYLPMQPAGPEVYDAEVVEPPDMEDFEDALEMEGVGALSRRWSPLVKMGRNFRIQAAEGYRAAVVPLKPGLFLVAELPEHVARSEFGIAPLLAPLVVRAASRAMSKPPEQRPLYRLFHRQGQAQGARQGQGRAFLQRMFRPRQAAMQQPVAQQRSLVPAPGSGHAQNQLLPAPALGAWVDPEDLAGLFDDGQGV